jgi:hypothetical protein
LLPPEPVDIVPPPAPPVFPIRISWDSHLAISIRQLVPAVAGEVRGIDCRRPLSPDRIAVIHAAMAEYAILVFRDQPLTDAEQLRFTPHFGELEETRGGTSGHIHFRTDREARRLGPRIVF